MKTSVVAEHGNHRIQQVDVGTRTVGKYEAAKVELDGSFPHKNMFLVSDGGNNCIKGFDQSGTLFL